MALPISKLISTNEGQTLFAIASELFVKGRLDRAEIIYVHATDSVHARNQYCVMHPNRRTHRIVAVAPVIGYFVHDAHGEELSVN